MNGFDSNDPRDEALWRLLGRAREVEPSPWFALRLRQGIDAKSAPSPGWWSLVMHRILPAGVCAALAVMAVVSINPAATPVARTEMEFETIQNLDLLVSNYESSLWLDSSPSAH
jgi:hypothetical protein